MYKNILVPVAFDDEVNSKAALDVAGLLADTDATVTLFHVVEQIPPYALTYVSRDFMIEARKAIEAELQKMSEGMANSKAVVMDGHSGRTILDYAKEDGSDCIVVASHRPGMQSILLGSTAAQVVRHAACAVHVIR